MSGNSYRFACRHKTRQRNAESGERWISSDRFLEAGSRVHDAEPSGCRRCGAVSRSLRPELDR